jgi:hypothetical protein
MATGAPGIKLDDGQKQETPGSSAPLKNAPTSGAVRKPAKAVFQGNGDTAGEHRLRMVSVWQRIAHPAVFSQISDNPSR